MHNKMKIMVWCAIYIILSAQIVFVLSNYCNNDGNPNPQGLYCCPGQRCLYSCYLGGAKCGDCFLGNYQDEASVASSCKSCPPGRKSMASGFTNCLDCEAGTFNDAEGLSECKACKTGQYQNEKGKTKCKLCDTSCMRIK